MKVKLMSKKWKIGATKRFEKFVICFKFIRRSHKEYNSRMSINEISCYMERVPIEFLEQFTDKLM